MKKLKIEPETTILNGKEFVKEHQMEGCVCPCCDQTVKIWKKMPISVAVMSFINLCKLYNNKQKYYHLSEFNYIEKDRNFSQLILWNLIEPKTNEDSTKRSSGMWKPTIRGLEWFSENIRIPKYVYTLNNTKLNYDDGILISMRDILGIKFNYAKLLENNKH